MTDAHPPKPVKFFLGLIYSMQVSLWDLERELQQRFDFIDQKSPVLDFSAFTGYYQPEMGPQLCRTWWSLQQPRDPGKLVELKLTANELEEQYRQRFSAEGRVVNIDPGYLNESRLVLASCKDFSHRIYLGGGVYGEVTLIYKKDGYKPLEWTYPDYKSPEALRFFQRLKGDYRRQMAEMENEDQAIYRE
jgi:hypothetical protein